MIKGIETHRFDETFAIEHYAVQGSRMVCNRYLGPGMMTLDLSGDVPVQRVFNWNKTHGYEGVHNLVALPGGRWLVQTYKGGGNNVEGRWRRTLDFDAIPEGDAEARTPCEHFFHALACVEGRALTTRYQDKETHLVEITDEGERLVGVSLQNTHGFSFETVRFGDSSEGLFWSGTVYRWSGDTMVSDIEIEYRGRVGLSRTYHHLTGQIAPWGKDGIYHVAPLHYLTNRGGKLMRSRPGQKAVCVMDKPPIEDLMGMPEGAVLATVKLGRGNFARVIFPEEGNWTNLNHKALGDADIAVSAIWYDEAREALVVAHRSGLIFVPWSGILAHRRTKLKPPSQWS